MFRVFILSIGLLALSQCLHSQETQSSELDFTEKLSKRFPDSAFTLLKEVYNRSVEKKDWLSTGTCLQQMGEICFYRSNYPKAIEFHQQADKLFRDRNAQEQQAGNLNDMGIVYYYNRQTTQALRHYNEALAIYQRLGHRQGMAETYGCIGHIFEKQSRYDSAFYFQQRALSIYNSIRNKKGIAKIYENIGSIYEDLAGYDSALVYFNNAWKIYQATNMEVDAIEVLNNIGDIYRKKGSYKEAFRWSYRAQALAEKTNDLYQKGAAYRDLGKTWNLVGQNDSAYHYIELSRRAVIDVYSLENNRQTAFLQVIFDIAQKNEEINRLENERHVTIITAIASLLVIALLVILGWVIISRQKLKIRNEKLLSEQERRIHETERELMQRELTNKQLKEEKLVQELEIKKKALATHTLHIIQKNQLLENFNSRLEVMVKDEKRDHKKQLQQLIRQIHGNFNHDQQWEEFQEGFEQVHLQFVEKLKTHSDNLTGNAH